MTPTHAAASGWRACWPARRVTTAVVATAVLAVAVGVPTGVVPTPLYTRMTPVLWWNYPVWATTAVLGGLVVATYIRRPRDATVSNGLAAASGGGILAAFAVGCPVCNKLVLVVLGVSGALSVWAPLQPVLGVLSMVGLTWALRRRLTGDDACSVADRARPPVDRTEGRPPDGDLWLQAICGALDRSPPPPPTDHGKRRGRRTG